MQTRAGNPSLPKLNWPSAGLTRVPYALYSDPAVYAAEQERIFRGPVWNFLCLEAELPNPGDYRTTRVGDCSVVVTRASDGVLHGLENRCAHRGALLCLKPRGNAKALTCAYHSWSYDLTGTLTGVAFRNGVDGQGGMEPGFRPEEHGLRTLKLAALRGLVFGSFESATPPLEEYLGAPIVARIERVLKEPIRLLGAYSQLLPNNWKLYVENVKDTYHASLLHTFFTTFRLNRLSQPGGVIVDASGGHHVSFSMLREPLQVEEYERAGLRAQQTGYRLRDPAMLAGYDEFGDGITLQILSVFPTFVLQQIQNCLVVRQIVPLSPDRTELNWTYFGFAGDSEEMLRRRLLQANLVGPGGYVSMEDGAVGGFVQRAIAGASTQAAVVEMGGAGTGSQNTRATETSVRGFWKAYRALFES